MKKTNVKIDILDSKENLLFSCVIHRLTVGLDSRRIELTQEVLERDVSDGVKGQLLSCAAFAACLHDEKGDLLYPDKDAVDKIYNTMDCEIYGQLCLAYNEVNPVNGSTLTTKKKKF